MSSQKQTIVLIMIETSVLGCGVDIPDVAVVIGAGTPQNLI